MYDLFNNELKISQGVQTLPQFVYIKSGYTRELLKLISYYRSNPGFVLNQHPLIRLILSTPVNISRSPESLVNHIVDVFYQSGSQLNFTNSLNYGRVYSPGFLYGKNTEEIIITHHDSFDIEEAYSNWEDLEPIKIIRHPFTDLSLGLLDGRYVSKEQGLVVATINIPMLFIMLKGWYDKNKFVTEGPVRTLSQFLFSYPLLNAIRSHFDICLFNRMYNHYVVEDVADFTKKHPFGINDYTDRFDDYAFKELHMLASLPREFNNLLENIPMVSKRNFREVIALPKVVKTRQVRWALLVSRIPVTRFLVKHNALELNQRNRSYLEIIKNTLRDITVDKTLDRILPTSVVKDIDDSIYRDIEPYLA